MKRLADWFDRFELSRTELRSVSNASASRAPTTSAEAFPRVFRISACSFVPWPGTTRSLAPGSPITRYSEERTTSDVAYSGAGDRSEAHTSELQSLMRISYAVFCLKKKKKPHTASTQ